MTTKRFLIAVLTCLLGAGIGFAQVGSTPGISTPLTLHTDNTWTGTNTFTGAVAFGTVTFGDGTVGAPSISFTADTNTGLYRIGNDNLGITAGGVKKVDVAADKTDIIALASGRSGTFSVQDDRLTFDIDTPTTSDIALSLRDVDAEVNFTKTAVASGNVLEWYTRGATAAHWLTATGEAGGTDYISRLYVSGASGAPFAELRTFFGTPTAQIRTGYGNPVGAGGAQVDLRTSGGTAADNVFAMTDQANIDFLTFTEVGGNNTVVLARNVTTPSLTETVTSTTGTIYSVLEQTDAQLDFALTGATTVNPHLELIDGASNAILTLTEAGAGNNTITVQQTIATPALVTTVTSAPATVYSVLEQTAAQLDFALTGATTGGAHFELLDAATNNVLQFSGVGGSAGNEVILAQNTGANPAWNLTVQTTANPDATLSVQSDRLTYNIDNPDDADIALNLLDSGTTNWLTFTDSDGGGSATVTYAQDVDGASSSIQVASGALSSTLQQDADRLQWNIANPTAADVSLDLHNQATSKDFLIFSDLTANSGVVTFRVATDADAPTLSLIASHANTPHDATLTLDGDDTPTLNLNVDDTAMNITPTQFQWDNISATPVAKDITFVLNDVAASVDILTVTDVATTHFVKITEAAATPILSLTADDAAGGQGILSVLSNGTGDGSVTITANGNLQDSRVALYDLGAFVSGYTPLGPAGNQVYTLVQGGYTVADGTPTAGDLTVTITLTDGGAASAPTQDVLVCGYDTAITQALLIKACETVSAIEGAVATVGTYVEVTQVKGRNKAAEDVDDRLTADFTGDSNIVASVALADQAKSDFTDAGAGDPVAVEANYWAAGCLDPLGCDVEVAAPTGTWYSDGRPLMIACRTDGGGVLYYPVNFNDGGTQNLSNDFACDDGDSLQMVYSRADSLWIELSESDN